MSKAFACRLASREPSRHYGRAELGGTLGQYRIGLVIGTRPEAIKLAPVAQALARSGEPPLLLLTGQHPGLALAEHGLAGYETQRLICPGSPDPNHHVALAARKIGGWIDQMRPDLLVVQGDTSSALGGVRAAVAAGIPLAHVEAGLRSFDLALPWPEEGFRREIDARASLLFAPTEISAANLAAEGCTGDVHVTGNSGIDALLAELARLPAPRPREAGKIKLLVTCHRRESWEAGIASVALALSSLARDDRIRIDVVLHPNPRVATAMGGLLGGHRAIRLLPPMAHGAMVAAMRDAHLILSDSGGMQEEAPALGVPLLLLRDKTERPEGVATGNVRLVGTNPAKIIAAVTGLLADQEAMAAMARPTFPYGDGRAAPRIAAAMLGWLAESALIDSPRRSQHSARADRP